MTSQEITLNRSAVETIEKILRQGNQVEVKIEQGAVTVVEIKRKLRYKDK